jgi:hypothetical protein
LEGCAREVIQRRCSGLGLHERVVGDMESDDRERADGEGRSFE